MPFKKGTSGNANGRKRGTPNKVTKLQREFIQKLMHEQRSKIKMKLEKLQGKECLTAIMSLMEFVIPKLNRSEINSNEITTIRVMRED
jgi:hypothetical protein